MKNYSITEHSDKMFHTHYNSIIRYSTKSLLLCLSFISLLGCHFFRHNYGENRPASTETSVMETDVIFEDSQSPLETRLHQPFSQIKNHNNHNTPSRTEVSPEIKKAQQTLDEALEFCEVAQEYWQQGELDNALQSLDHAYELILQVNDDDQDLMQQRYDLRYTISKRIMEIYASRNLVANGTHEAIPVILNEHVKFEIEQLTTRERSFFIEAYRKSGIYRPKIIQALKEAGLPTSLSWLPLIESGFKVRALSTSRALGLWQFISSTGYKFGLSRNLYVDERMDPDKATIAAIAYLKELHQIFGDWSTALAAYNCGENKVLRIIQSQNVNYLDNFWDLYDKLPRETARYVPRFLATLHIVENMQQYGLDPNNIASPIEYEPIEISKQILILDIANTLGVPESNLIMLNPELRHRFTPPDSYILKVPNGKSTILLAAIETIPVYTPQPTVYVENPDSHKVAKGETLSSISRQYNISVNVLKKINHIKANSISVGQKLTLLSKAKDQDRVTSSRPAPKIIIHTVTKGDSLWNIAHRYNATAQQIQKSNKLSSATLYIGQKLKIPSSSGTTVVTKSRSYKVKQGDTPFRIAVKHNMSLAGFLRLNRLNPNSKIFPGQTVSVE